MGVSFICKPCNSFFPLYKVGLTGFYKLEDKENFIHWHPNSKNETHILSFIESVNEISADDIQLEWITH